MERKMDPEVEADCFDPHRGEYMVYWDKYRDLIGVRDERTMTQRIEDHDQAEYVRGIQAGRRIERQNTYAKNTIPRELAWLCLGLIIGAVLF